jgi:hypothetical protein
MWMPRTPNGLSRPRDDDAHAADDALLVQERRAVEPGLGAQVTDDHRAIAVQDVAGLRVESGPDRRAADQPLAPTDPGAESEGLAVGLQLEDFAELDVETRGEPRGRLVHQAVEVDPHQGPLAQLGDGGALPRVRLELFLGPPTVVDVGAGAKPLDDAAVRVGQGEPAGQEPAKGAVRPPEAIFDLVRLAGRHGPAPALDGPGPIVRVEQFGPPPALQLVERPPGEVDPAAVEVSQWHQISCSFAADPVRPDCVVPLR